MKLTQEAKFNEHVSAVLVYLAKNFPTPISLDAVSVGIEIAHQEPETPPVEMGGMSEVSPAPSPTDDEKFFGDSVRWLRSEGLLNADDQRFRVSFENAVLTYKGLNLLEAVPGVLRKHWFD